MQLHGGVVREFDVDFERFLGAAIDDLQLGRPASAFVVVLHIEIDGFARARIRWQPTTKGQSVPRRRWRGEVTGRVPVRASEVYLAARSVQTGGKFLTSGNIVSEPDGVPSRYVAEWADPANFDKNRAARVAAERHAGLEEHIRTRLSCGLRLGIAVTVAVV